MKKILILGGTNFIGRNLVQQLIALNQFDVTLFNRGKTNPALFPTVRKIVGDRKTNDIEQLSKEQYDVVMDISCYYPADLSNILKVLQGKPRYILISSCSVYKPAPIFQTEAHTLLTCTEAEAVGTTNASYGQRKAECDRVLMTTDLDYLILRPSIVYGAYDYTDRFYYWLYQVREQATLLVPDNGKQLFSCTYVQDLVASMIEGISIENHQKIYNVVTHSKISISEMIKTAESLLQKSPTWLNASPEFLHEQKVGQWVEMPLWIDSDYYLYSNEQLVKDFQLKLTGIEDGFQATIEYHNEIGWTVPTYGMSEERRQELMGKL